MRRKSKNDAKIKRKPKYDGDFGQITSTGSTLLDLAISGGRVHGGGLPGRIFVEIFGPSSSGKTVLLSEIAGAVIRGKGQAMFRDPEARLNETFAKIFDLDLSKIEYSIPTTVPQVFKPIRKWEPTSLDVVNGAFIDSLAALSTDLEMSKDEGDKMGMKRAKEFSEHLRRTCRIITEKNFLVVASNQIRESSDGFGTTYKSPGGMAIAFYASLRLRMLNTEKIWAKRTVAGKEVKRVVGVKTNVEVFKSSIWKPYHIAPLTIYFDYGIDDIRQNLQFIKSYTSNTVYSVGGNKIDKSMEVAIDVVESEGLEKELREEVIDLWEFIESKFDVKRKPKVR
jgi:RecA/RadA recombinase